MTVSQEALSVEHQGIVEAFGGNAVLHGVDFELRKGEVHALMGGNGAGKSTLMKILEGVHAPDGGEVKVDGAPVQIRSPQEAQENGITMIFQEFSLIPTLSVAENIFLNSEPRNKGGLLDDQESRRRSREIFAEMGEDIDPGAIVGNLPTGYWQLTEIAKALSREAQILIMDEPTSSLTKTESEALFALIQKFKASGTPLVLLSHPTGR